MRALVALAIRTGIPPAAWAAEGEAAIVTALDLLLSTDDRLDRGSGPQMSG